MLWHGPATDRTAVLLSGWADAAPWPIRRPAPAPPPEVRLQENQGELKAATWRAAAAAEAGRVGLLRVAIRKARKSTTVAGALRLARLTGRISPATQAGSRATTPRLGAPPPAHRRARERDAHRLGTVDSLAAVHLLDAGRLRPVFLVLRRNTEFWTHAAFPLRPRARRSATTPPCSSTTPAAACSSRRWPAGARPTGWPASACAAHEGPRRAACPAAELRRTIDRLLELGAQRGDFIAWEYYFSWGGGTPPWISGMTQATAVSALARAGRALDVPRWRKAAHRALGAFRTPPPVGVDGGDHFLMYSFAPSLRVFNGELQAVSGIGELAALYPQDKLAAHCSGAASARRAASSRRRTPAPGRCTRCPAASRRSATTS